MSGVPAAEWQSEFGIAGRAAPTFLNSKDDIEPGGGSVPQAHVVRRAFDLLELNREES